MVSSSHLLTFVWYCLFPLWLLAGFSDYLFHRKTAIERTSGHSESILHVAQAAQLAPALLAVVFLRINALVLAIVWISVIVHTLTAYWDLRYTTGKRFIPASEQLVHALLLLLPLFAAALLAVIYWSPFRTLLSLSGAAEAWVLALKTEPVAAHHLALILGGTLVLNLLPLAEEFWRTRTAVRVPLARTPS